MVVGAAWPSSGWVTLGPAREGRRGGGGGRGDPNYQIYSGDCFFYFFPLTLIYWKQHKVYGSIRKIIKIVVFRCLQCKLTLDNAEELRSHVENPECKGPIYAKVSLKPYTKSDIIDFDLL